MWTSCMCVLLLSQKSYIVALERSDPLFVQRTLSLDMQYNPWQRVMVQVAPELASYWLAFKKRHDSIVGAFLRPVRKVREVSIRPQVHACLLPWQPDVMVGSHSNL